MEENGNGEVSSARRNTSCRDPSSALAEKLLQGWTMLQDHCPQCLTPLVRNRLRRIYCVGCDQWVVSQQEPPVQVPQDQSQGQDRPADSSGHIPATATTTTTTTTDSRSGLATNSDVSHPSPAKVGDTSQTFLIPKIEFTSRTVIEQVLPDISDILAHKLKELGIALSKSQDLDDIRKLMDAIRECLHTIKDVKMMI